MKIGETKVIDQREEGSMGGGCWQEFLVLEKLGDTEFQLDIRGWEYLGSISEFDFEEDKYGELILPEEVNGKYISSVEEESVYGGELVRSGGEQGEVKFAHPDQGKVISWLKGLHWHDEDVIKALMKECSEV